MKILKYLLVSLLMLLPTFAQADTIVKPPGKEMWEMHVMGNGPVIASVLESVKLVIAPDAGGGGFRSLLVFMAILGFCILAIQAGFNPGQNLFKMFGYLFVVWVVSLTATQLKAHMLVIDPISHTETAVMRVPAVVAIPAAVVSGVGHFLTKTMQQAYSTAGKDIALTDAGFDIFGKIQTDLDNFTITQPELQRSMSAFVADCTIPAIAQKRMTAAEMMTSIDLLKTLEKAKGDVFMTRYWPTAEGKAAASSLMLESGIVTCSQSYNAISADIEKHATQLLNASSREYSRSGVMVPWEAQLQTYMEAANIGKVAGGGTYGRPTGIITQKALINTMSGDFRQAAVQTGNNELLMGVQISQAEQSQRSGWVTSAAIFKNMMGYVYTTLQAFIFAIVPIVVVALMIPGLGKKIFVNYGQILVWLTLWEPMLSIVNYLVTLFRLEGLRNATHDAGGFNAANSWVISEGANNMVIAASFLGTMVPILTWGLVTGAMAFNEFISQGVGSSFAMTAGANAATGTSAMNNMNMNNASNNAFSTAQKATVGSQQVMAHESAGSLMVSSEQGGYGISKDGANVSAAGTLSSATALAATTAVNASSTSSGSRGNTAGETRSTNESSGTSAKWDSTQGVGQDSALATTAAKTNSVGTSKSTGNSSKHDQTGGASEKSNLVGSVGTGANVGGGGGGGGGAGAGAGGGKKNPLSALKSQGGVNAAQTTENSIGMSDTVSKSASDSTKADSSTNTGQTASQTNSSKNSESTSRGRSHDNSSAKGKSAGSTLGVSKADAIATSAGTSSTMTNTGGVQTSIPMSMTRDDFNAQDARVNAYSDDPRQALAAVRAQTDVVAASMDQTGALVGVATQNLQGAGTGPTSFGLTGAGGPGANIAPLMNEANAQVAATTNAVGAGVATQTASSVGAIQGHAAGATTLGGTTQIQAGTGSTALQADDSVSAKKVGLGVGMAASAVGSIMDFAGTARAAQAATGLGSLGAAGAGGAATTAGGITAGGLAIGTLAVGGAAVAGWGAGRGFVHLVGEDNVAAVLDPVFKELDYLTNDSLHKLF